MMRPVANGLRRTVATCRLASALWLGAIVIAPARAATDMDPQMGIDGLSPYATVSEVKRRFPAMEALQTYGRGMQSAYVDLPSFEGARANAELVFLPDERTGQLVLTAVRIAYRSTTRADNHLVFERLHVDLQSEFGAPVVGTFNGAPGYGFCLRDPDVDVRLGTSSQDMGTTVVYNAGFEPAQFCGSVAASAAQDSPPVSVAAEEAVALQSPAPATDTRSPSDLSLSGRP